MADRIQVLTAAGLIAAGTLPAAAVTTAVSPPWPGEATHAEVFGAAYGGAFFASGLGFTNGSITAERVDDADDQLFGTSIVSAQARALFADFDQLFGYLAGGSGGSFTELFGVSGYGYGATGSVAGTIIDGPFRFARDGSQGVLASSRDADNPSGADQMVTYRLTGAGFNEPVFVLFFEDTAIGGSDRDFQDLVVEVRGIGATIIPTPAALGAGLSLLCGLGLRRGRREA